MKDLTFIAGHSDDQFAIWGAIDGGPDTAYRLTNYLITGSDGTRLLVKSVWEIQVLARGTGFVSHSKGPVKGAEDVDKNHDVVVLRGLEWIDTQVLQHTRHFSNKPQKTTYLPQPSHES